MKRINRGWIALAMAPAFAVVLAVPNVSSATTKGKHVKCEVTKDGKKTHEMVATSKDCTAMDGTVIPPHKTTTTTTTHHTTTTTHHEPEPKPAQ